MTYKEFKEWAAARAADGCWGIGEISICVSAMAEVEAVRCLMPWKKDKMKEKKWQEVEAKYEIMETIVKPINEYRAERDIHSSLKKERGKRIKVNPIDDYKGNIEAIKKI